MKMESYLSELTAQLHLRGIDEARISEIIAEVESHLTESGEVPIEAFGGPAQYAEERATFGEKQTSEVAEKADNGPILYHNRTFRATALDEMGILEYAGNDGWELMDVGALALFCRRPEDLSKAGKWEYKRRTGTHRRIIEGEMATGKWEPCGNWIVFHYFKRLRAN